MGDIIQASFELFCKNLRFWFRENLLRNHNWSYWFFHSLVLHKHLFLQFQDIKWIFIFPRRFHKKIHRLFLLYLFWLSSLNSRAWNRWFYWHWRLILMLVCHLRLKLYKSGWFRPMVVNLCSQYSDYSFLHRGIRISAKSREKYPR